MESYFVPKEFKMGERVPKYDYAILKLEKEVKTTNFIPLISDLKEIKTAQVKIFGYPEHEDNLMGKE